MKATEAQLLGFLKKSPQFIIPIYQRTYSWTERECRQLWDDVIRAGENQEISVHFIGSIVYVEERQSQISHQSPLLVIDGQQRLTTITLLLAALSKELGGGEPVDGFSARKLRNYYLLNPEENGERHFKLLLSQTDKTTLKAIVDEKEFPQDYSLRVKENFRQFQDLIADCHGELAPICNGLAKLMVVDIALSRDQDNPQLIFESMNSTGRELSQADLIRNFVLMGLEPLLQTRLYEEFWRPMELAFGQEAYTSDFDAFMRHYLTLRTGDIPRQDQVYAAFKDHARSRNATGPAVELLVKELLDFSRYYCAMALGAEEDSDLKLAFSDLRELKVDVAYPFLLELYADYKQNILHKEELLEAVRLVESYVFRRAVCNIPTNSLNKTFATFTKALKKNRYLESIKAHFLLLPSYRRFPNDDEFWRDVQTRDLYNFRSRSYWLRRLENYGRKERVPVDEYTIEHIMPQNDALPQAWRAMLGSEWKRIHETYLHTLGNLTLTGYNSEYSDKPFIEKRDIVGGFKESPLKVNKGLGELDVWDESSIKTRAERLAQEVVKVWGSPGISMEILEAYKPVPASRDSYSISDHQSLLSGQMSHLFAAFRREVLALDPCVTEDFLKLYVAYKAETNFVDVVPQTKQLRLTLNLRFAEINDPKGMCRDVTGLGKWGNGDVEIQLSTVNDLGYVIGLVRQSLERQLGSEIAD
ncbi:DUF262 and DUF1524 domain-containing protein [Acetobacter orleanensis]|uniref:DUF262 domain-containing protein n=1 Tax=Acetobacter orleanensis TaxID=104099 RepID=A0A4Y3TSV3_9PROT|nr:DUF262 and DUF1524 domain-containing protein [Acetobacter orleanensis]KXV67132.1 hypothetical protein AD949_00445 [Acetobacter orleanensis]PCD78261.1 hypothetical protein CO710_13275 [Acetobacter orleanensis]GAN69846.1 hypothetical protein Abol_092_001 [Acetobacter orleanensis JCM 7639]GBR28673.1 hypothetical protein AA0473_1815 [Acetobacter orleanensis NRIC 0473]GEB84177.1 hypothetical protein AOR01nite_26540 [Acetobacter orleanensis]